MTYYQDNHIKIFNKDCRSMDELPDESIDLLCTDPPYGISFMGKDWDKALPDIEVWRECLRVLKAGSFAFVMSIPRADCLSRMIIALEDAGFWVNFTPIFWAYASGFPKAQNIGKVVDKRLGVERKVVGKGVSQPAKSGHFVGMTADNINKTEGRFSPDLAPIPATPQAKALDGSYGGFQPKPAVEVIIVAMKPLSEKTFVDQALKNRKGVTWLDDCRIPYESEGDREGTKVGFTSSMPVKAGWHNHDEGFNPSESSIDRAGRFPANLLVSDDVLNDGRISKSSKVGFKGVGWKHSGNTKNEMTELKYQQEFSDSGSFSRYFDLDKWWAKTFPFLVVPKASKSEKDRYLEVSKSEIDTRTDTAKGSMVEKGLQAGRNIHPTVKPIKLMSYLITLGSREGDVVLDNFAGSGTTGVAAALLNRKCVMYETRKDYCQLTVERCRQQVLL